MKWYEKKVRGWIVPLWFTDTPLYSKKAVNYGLGNCASLVREQRKS